MSRKILFIIVILSLVINLTGCGSAHKMNRYEAEFLELFDTVTKIVGYTETKEEFTEYAQFIYDNLKEYHQLYDIYNDYDGVNNIKTINDNAGIRPVKVDQKIIDLLLFAKEENKLSNGELNVAFGAVLSVWHKYRDAGIEKPDKAELPPMDVLEEAAKHTDIDKVIIDEDAMTVYLDDPEMSLDVGAIAKGYATEKVANLVYEKGFTSGMLSVGGNIRALGVKADSKEKWNVGIQNPDLESEQTNILTLSLSDMSLVTSGDYERYYMVDGQRYCHIINKDTLMPSNTFRSVTILSKDSGKADGLSTTLFNMSYDDGLKLIEELPETEAVWIFPNGDIKYSSHFKDYLKQ